MSLHVIVDLATRDHERPSPSVLVKEEAGTLGDLGRAGPGGCLLLQGPSWHWQEEIRHQGISQLPAIVKAAPTSPSPF